MDKYRRRFADGRAEELRAMFECCNTTLLRVADSGGVGLNARQEKIYEYLWENKERLLNREFLPHFIDNDKRYTS